MYKLLITLGVLWVIYLLVWVAGAFIAWDISWLDPIRWGRDDRVAFLFLLFFSTGAGIGAAGHIAR